MSTLEQRVIVITEFLENRARLQRVTNFQEIQRVATEKLATTPLDMVFSPLSRDEVEEALTMIAKNSFEANQLILPALVVHFWDNKPVHQFATWASNAGLMLGFLGEDEQGAAREQINQIHPRELVKVFEHYAQMPEQISQTTG